MIIKWPWVNRNNHSKICIIGMLYGKCSRKGRTFSKFGNKFRKTFMRSSTTFHIDNTYSGYFFSNIKTYSIVNNRKNNIILFSEKVYFYTCGFSVFDYIIQLFLNNSENIQIEPGAHQDV